MSLDSSSFTSMSPLSSIPVMTADDTPMPLTGVGSVVTPHLSLPNVYLIPKIKLNLTPKIKLNLTSVGQICDSGDYLVMFSGSFCETLEIYNLNMQMRKPSCKRKTESGNISMSDGNQD